MHNFIKYLPELGIQAGIITATEELYEFDYFKDEQLLKFYDSERVEILRVNSWIGRILIKRKRKIIGRSPSKNYLKKNKSLISSIIKGLLFPDEYLFFIWNGYMKGYSILKNNEFDFIFATTPVFSNIIVGKLLSMTFRVPLILDYRDLFSINPFRNQGSKLRNYLLRKLEAWAVKNSCLILFTNQAAANSFTSHFKLRNYNVQVLPNGFDKKMLSKIEPKRNHEDVFIISHIGNLTQKRSPKYFLNALSRVMSLNKNLKLRVDLIGFVAPQHLGTIEELGLASFVNLPGTVSKEEAMQAMVNSDLLLIFQRSDEGGKTAIPGKLYEYLASGIPTMVMDEDYGSTSQFMIEELSLEKYVAEYEDEDHIFNILNILINDYSNCKREFAQIPEQMIPYDRQNICKSLNNLISKLKR